MSAKGETLSESELGRAKPVKGEGGRSLRAFCPFHGGDQQRSLRVDTDSGRFQCFACGVWGYMDWARAKFANAQELDKSTKTYRAARQKAASPDAGAKQDWSAKLRDYQLALEGSAGAEYLEERKIPLSLAQELGIGYAAAGRWAHQDENGKVLRDWKWGRLVFPHTSPTGLVNLYGRAVSALAPKALRHDHLPGTKGYFHFPALALHKRVFVCEGPFDALSLMAATGQRNAIAIFGVNGWRPQWAGDVAEFVFAMDTDAAGEKGWRQIAQGLSIRGRRVRYLEAEAYGGAKDINEAWVDGSLDLEQLQEK